MLFAGCLNQTGLLVLLCVNPSWCFGQTNPLFPEKSLSASWFHVDLTSEYQMYFHTSILL